MAKDPFDRSSMPEQTYKTGGSDNQTHANTALSGKPPATDQKLLQEILELTARNEYGEVRRRLNEHLGGTREIINH